MRLLRCLAAGLVVLAGGPVLAAAATSASAAPALDATLTLDPSSGKASTTITAVFQVDGMDNNRCHLRVTYSWDNQQLGQNRTEGCTSKVRIRPPHDGRDPGPHQITAVDGTTHQTATAVFTIGAADATATPTAGATTPDMTDTGPADVGPPPVDSASANPSAAAVPQAVPQTKASSSTPFSLVALIIGGALLLGGVVILVMVVLRMRGDGHGRYDDELPYEPPPAPLSGSGRLGEYPTQRMPSPEHTQPLGYGPATATQRLEYPPPPEVPD
jgi:hypothetical protein